jgi:hypothetical protein
MELFMKEFSNINRTKFEVLIHISNIQKELSKNKISSLENQTILDQIKETHKTHDDDNQFQSKHIDSFNKNITDVLIISCITCERLFFLKQLKHITKTLKNRLSNHFNIEEKNEIKLYVCYNCLNNFNKNKTPLYLVPNSISRNEIIPLVQRLTQLEEQLISPCLAFAQIYKIHGYGQYSIHGSIINVPSNINETQSILPRLPHDDLTIGILLKRRLEYKSPYMCGNVRPNYIILALNDLLKTPLYINSNVTVRRDWKGLFNMHIQSQTKNVEVLNTTSALDISYSSDASIESNSDEASNSSDSSDASNSTNPSNASNPSDSNDEKNGNIQTDTMIHNFLNTSKISDYENIVYSIAPCQDYHPLGLF